MRYRQISDSFRPPDHRSHKYRERAAEVVLSVPVSTENPILSFTVMAHKKREKWAEEIAEEIGCNITWDQKNDRHETGLRAIESYDANATHHCVVQDDVILAKDFVNLVQDACRYVPPNSPIGLYYGGKGARKSAHFKAGQDADEANASWIVRKGPIWGPGIVYPIASIKQLAWYFKVSPIQNYDRRVMKYYQSVGADCWYTNPSLVDHRQEDNPSLCGHDKGNRVARNFASPQTGIEVDWSGPVLKAKL
jgi:hypothetical protein